MLSYDNVRDRFKDELYVTRVRGLRDVRVDCLATGISVQTDKLVSDEVDAILVGVVTCGIIGAGWGWR